jgi:hypothetical protein
MYQPNDPACPVVQGFYDGMDEDPMNAHVPGDVLIDLIRDFNRKHQRACPRCLAYGLANIEEDEA